MTFYYVSCREGFTNTMAFHPDPILYRPYVRLDPMAPNLYWPEFVDTLGFSQMNYRTLILLHGYASTLGDVVSAYREIIAMKAPGWWDARYDAVLGFLMPLSWSASVGFLAASLRVGKCATWLRYVIADLTAVGVQVDVLAHSLGCRVLAEAMRQETPWPHGVHNALFCGAAMDRTTVQAGKKYGRLNIESAMFQYSRNDPVMTKAYRVVPQNWFTPALGAVGPDPRKEHNKRMTFYDCSASVSSHGGYKRLSETYSLLYDGPGAALASGGNLGRGA